ncbi:hypothetical protein BT69DRAFT_562036 [Atractiella rhizophila]|nr:hypothetical protein BT69DRAFT_562036 [Atractiella rhizophila]
MFIAHRPLVHIIIGRLPYFCLRIIQASGVGRDTKVINIMQEVEVSIGHFTLLYTAVDVLPILVGQLHGKKHAQFAGLLGLVMNVRVFHRSHTSI